MRRGGLGAVNVGKGSEEPVANPQNKTANVNGRPVLRAHLQSDADGREKTRYPETGFPTEMDGKDSSESGGEKRAENGEGGD